jgi:aldehyde dehydrogenase (NAD+)
MTKDMRIAKEEIFGPIAGVMRVKDLDEAIEVANSVDYGLCASICTSNLTAAHEFVNRVEAGVIKVNKPTIGLELQAPFGGYKNSSSLTFKEQGEVAIEIYTKQKTVYLSF